MHFNRKTRERVDKKLVADAEKLAGKLSKIRRRIHMYPELAYQEKRTSEFVADTLRGMGIEVRTGVAKTGVVGVLRGASKGKTVAFRGDMDALPITEQNQKPYVSRVPGVMHACGHDANTTTVLGTAMLLAQRLSRLKGNAKFIFQPSEEAPPGGALPMIKDGALKSPKVDWIIGVHVDSTVQVGKIGLRDGHMMAAADDFSLSITGEAAHGAKPHLGVDAIQLQAQVIQALQQVVSRKMDPTHPVVLTLGTIHGGYRQNVIADRVDIEGTLRTLYPGDRKKAPKMIERIVRKVTEAFGGGYEFEYRLGYPSLSCDPKLNAVVQSTMEELFGKRSVVELDTPSMGGEDFAYFANEVPGMMLRLGTRNKQLGFDYPWHHPKFDIDEKGLWVGAAVMAGTGMRLLNGE